MRNQTYILKCVENYFKKCNFYKNILIAVFQPELHVKISI